VYGLLTAQLLYVDSPRNSLLSHADMHAWLMQRVAGPPPPAHAASWEGPPRPTSTPETPPLGAGYAGGASAVSPQSGAWQAQQAQQAQGLLPASAVMGPDLASHEGGRAGLHECMLVWKGGQEAAGR
jgi:hypothetical protein